MTTDATPPTPAPLKIKRRWRTWLAMTVLPVSALGAAVLGTWWALKQDQGTQWLLRQVPGLVVDAPRGALLGDFSARRLVYTVPGTLDRITIDGLQWQGLTLAWAESPRLWGALHADRLHADAVDVALAPSKAPASPPPTDLSLALGIDIGRLEVDRITLPALAGRPLLGLRGSLALSADNGSLHRANVDALQWEQFHLQGKAAIQTAGPMTLAAQLVLQPDPTGDALHDWRGGLELSGPLKALQARADVQAAGQSLHAQASLQPFAPWPLAAFTASADKLDLAALLGGMPHTALTGEAHLLSKAWNEPAELQVQMSNAAAGRWDQQRLPVQSISLALQGRADQPDSLRLSALDALLGSTAAPAGRVRGEGQLGANEAWALTARLSGIRPAALDARAAALQLDGKLELSGATGAPLKLAAQLSGLWAVNAKQKATPVQLGLQASLVGRKLSISQALLQSGASQLALTGEADDAPGGWRAAADLKVQAFDPRLLWAGTAGSAWQRGSNALNARGQLKLQQGKTWPQGEVHLDLQPSQLAGVALTGKLDYVHAAAGEAVLSAQLEAGDNKLLAISHVPDAALPSAISTQMELQAPHLAALDPLLAMLDPGAHLSGAADGKVGVQLQRGADQKWQFSSDGSLNAKSLRLAGPMSASLVEGRMRWAAGSKLDSPLVLDANLDHLAVGLQTFTRLSLDLQGTWADHRLKASLQGQPARGSAIEGQLALSGALSGPPAQLWQYLTPLSWKSRIADLQLRAASSTGNAGNTSNDKQAPLLKAAGLDLQVSLGASGVTAASFAPAQIELAGAQLRWTDLQWQAARSTAERADLRAQIEMAPLAVAPLLARWQPDFGWGGPLVVVGHASVHTAPVLDVDIVLERSQGDLSVTDERGVQPLGLTDLRLALNARDGLWQFTQALAGTNMGSLGGVVSVHAERNALWPAPASKLDGVLQANVARLGTWGAWVPAGWRLGGSLEAGVQLGGSFGSPELLGHAKGERIAVRNPLLGVDVTNGVFEMNLNGATARLISLSANGGKGTLSASGEAMLGEQETAKLQVKADHFVLLNRVDRRLSASGQAQLDLGPKSLDLDGRFNIDEGMFDFSRGDAPTLDDDVTVIRPDQPMADAAPKPAAKPAEPRKTHITLAINLGQDLKLRGHGLDSRLRGELKLVQNDANTPPSLTGTVSTSGGSYAAYGQKLEVERGEITFVGPYDNPRLDVLAVRPNLDTRVGVAVTGTALNPVIKLYSDPDMADTDKLTWLLMGRGPDGLGRADTALIQQAALALLSGEGESATGKIIKGIGLDELSVAQSDDTTQGTIVHLGKQLSRRWYVGYERGLNATAGSWQLIYRIAQRFTLRAQGGADNALDLIWQWKWQ